MNRVDVDDAIYRASYGGVVPEDQALRLHKFLTHLIETARWWWQRQLLRVVRGYVTDFLWERDINVPKE